MLNSIAEQDCDSHSLDVETVKCGYLLVLRQCADNLQHTTCPFRTAYQQVGHVDIGLVVQKGTAVDAADMQPMRRSHCSGAVSGSRRRRGPNSTAGSGT